MAKKNILDYINSNLLKEKSVTNFGITLFAIMVALLIFMITVRNTYDSTEIPPIKLPQGLCPCPDNDDDTYTLDTSVFDDDDF